MSVRVLHTLNRQRTEERRKGKGSWTRSRRHPSGKHGDIRHVRDDNRRRRFRRGTWSTYATLPSSPVPCVHTTPVPTHTTLNGLPCYRCLDRKLVVPDTQ